MAPSDHAVSGGGRLLPCMFSCMPTVPVRALGFRVCTCAWDGGTAPRRYGLRLGMTRLEYNNPLLHGYLPSCVLTSVAASVGCAQSSPPGEPEMMSHLDRALYDRRA